MTNQITPLPAFIQNMSDNQLNQYVDTCQALLQSTPTLDILTATE